MKGRHQYAAAVLRRADHKRGAWIRRSAHFEQTRGNELSRGCLHLPGPQHQRQDHATAEDPEQKAMGGTHGSGKGVCRRSIGPDERRDIGREWQARRTAAGSGLGSGARVNEIEFYEMGWHHGPGEGEKAGPPLPGWRNDKMKVAVW
jgi:hypothetical protein